MYCPNPDCVYNQSEFLGVPYCPRASCVYENDMKNYIAAEIANIYKRKKISKKGYERIEKLKELYHSQESG